MDPHGKSQSNAPKRSRLMLSKVRTGCLTCKTRRVKCDEQKPICNRCISAKRHCAGYQTPQKIRPRPFHITYYVPDPMSEVKALHLPLEDVQDQRALGFFYQWSTSCFPGELVLPFRDGNVLQEPALRHAMIAQGKLYEAYLYGTTASSQYESRVSAMRHYGKALRELVSSDPKPTDDRASVFLIACFLFVCLENCQGHQKTALSHLQSGFKLFQEIKESGRLNKECEAIFRSFFTRLICQMTHFDFADCARFLGLDGSPSKGPATFISLDNARMHLVNILQKMIHRRHPATLNTGSSSQEAKLFVTEVLLAQELVELDTWILAFNHYLSFGISNDYACESYVLAISSFLLKFRIMTDYQKPGLHEMRDHFDFKHIIELGKILSIDSKFAGNSSPQSCVANGSQQDIWCPLHQMFETEDANPKSPQQKYTPIIPHFLFFDILCSLSVASVHAPDLNVRQQARELVANICQCQKGWDSALTVYLAHCLSNSSKQGLCLDEDTLFQISTSDVYYSHESRRLIALLTEFGKL